MNLDDETLARIVDAVVRQMAESVATTSTVTNEPGIPCGGTEGHACTAAPRPTHMVERPIYEAMLPRLVALTSSRVAVGRSGNRFRTDQYLLSREGQADARDAVHTDVPEQWPARNGLVALRTQCTTRHEYLLYPNRGRTLDAVSRATVEQTQSPAPDVQIVVGDGLSPNAVLQNGPDTLKALKQTLSSVGLRTGTDYFVQFARIAVADEIGVLTRARATIVLVGERPGLGTGDSLSLYLAVNPRIGQDNAEKNCISNVRPIGIHPSEAATQSVAILQRSFERGVGGVALGLGWGRQ